MVVKGTTKSGIEFHLDSKVKDDARLLFLLTKSQKSEEPMEQAKVVMDLLSLIFGSDDNVLAFMNEVADKHKGICSAKEMLAELQEMFDALNTKN